MGNVLPPPPMDYRTERTMKQFNLPMEKVEKLWHIFCHADHSGSGYLTKDQFFDNIIHYKQTCLTDHMFRLIESKSDSSISFGEFVEIVTTFACFEKKELLRYFFYILDTHRTGLIEKTELKHFVTNMWEKEALTNVTDGLEYLDSIDDGDGAFNFAQIMAMQARYPITMYPVYRLQVCIIQNTLGELWWERHKAGLIEARDELFIKAEKELKQKRKRDKKNSDPVTDDMVRQRMGDFQFFLMPWKRKAVKKHMLRIVALEAELDKTYSTRHTYGTAASAGSTAASSTKSGAAGVSYVYGK